MKRSTPQLLACVALAAGCASSGRPASTPSPPAAASPAPDQPLTILDVGSLLARGGRQLTGPQVRALLTGAVAQGTSDGAAWREMSFADGKVVGQSTTSGGATVDYEGTWWIDPQGRRCWNNERLATATPTCMFYYVLDGRYYASASDSSRRDARLTMQRIARPDRNPDRH